jgi:hypothetical protein
MMDIVQFKECNVIYAENQPEYLPLPAHRSKDGTVTSCWKMSWKERLRVLFTGKVFLQLLTFNKPLQPQWMTVNNPVKGVSDGE